MPELKKAIVITGHYGCGKTNVAVNLAVHFARKGERVCIVDLDIVNPYFRTADFGELFDEMGIRMIAPQYANTNLDIPSLSFDINALLDGCDRLILDVGGDDAGAVALGQYAAALKAAGCDMLYVVNKYRFLTRTPAECIELLRDIEQASSIKATGIVNSSNLGMETTAADVLDSVPFAQECAELAGIPVRLSVVERSLGLEEFFPVEVYIRPFWEEK